MSNVIQDPLKDAVEAASGGKQTVLWTKSGFPTYMNVIPRFNLEDLHPSLGTGPHPAFVVNGEVKERIFIGTYQAVLQDGEAISLPNQVPETSINFNSARQACLNAGPGFHLMTNWEWAAIALWCAAKGIDVRGNTSWGKSHSRKDEKGTTAGSNKTLTGSGPDSWRHDGTPFGIADLMGNVWEWVDGMKLVGGKITMPADNAVGATEEAWADTGLCLNGANGIQISDQVTRRGWLDKKFNEVHGTDGHPPLATIRQALLCPTPTLDLPGHFWANNTEGFEARPLRGGHWFNESYAGLAALNLFFGRSLAFSRVGFRPAFIE